MELFARPDVFEEDWPSDCPVCGSGLHDPGLVTLRTDGEVTLNCYDCGVQWHWQKGYHDDTREWFVDCHYCGKPRNFWEDVIPEEPCRHCRKLLRDTLKGGGHDPDRE